MKQKLPKKVFCIGLGKTGTKTFGRCMTKLGYRHRAGPMYEGLLLLRLGHVESILDITHQFDSFDDFPWPFLYRTLVKRFEDARFVLTTRRDPETWFNSLSQHNLRRGPREAHKLAYGYYESHLHPEK